MNDGDGCVKQILIGAVGQLVGALLFVAVGLGIYYIFYFNIFNPIDNLPNVTNTDSPTDVPTATNTTASTVTNTDSPTDAPTSTNTTAPIATNTDNSTDAVTATNTTAPSAFPNPNALERAANFTGTRNDDWLSYIHPFADGVQMALVPAGCFIMGKNGAGGRACFDAFWIDESEVTQADFERLGGEQANPSNFTGDDLPVENITWFESYEYCQAQGKRLPSEAEWEYAARGVESWVFPWGDEFIEENAVSYDNSNNRTANVMSRPSGASWVGAQDMVGNVGEWTNSLYQDYPYNSVDGRESSADRTNGRVRRGGSWYNLTDNLYVSVRSGAYPAGWGDYIGFRCARDIDN